MRPSALRHERRIHELSIRFEPWVLELEARKGVRVEAKEVASNLVSRGVYRKRMEKQEVEVRIDPNSEFLIRVIDRKRDLLDFFLLVTIGFSMLGAIYFQPSRFAIDGSYVGFLVSLLGVTGFYLYRMAEFSKGKTLLIRSVT